MNKNKEYVIYLSENKCKVCYYEGMTAQDALNIFLYYNPCYKDRVNVTTKYGYMKIRHQIRHQVN